MATSGEFLWVGNHPGVDFCNTEPVVDGRPVDLLAEPGDLDRWMAAVAGEGTNRAVAPSPATEPTLAWARSLRSALRGFLLPATRSRDTRQELNAVLAQVPAAAAVDPDGRLVLVPPAGPAPPAPASAASAASASDGADHRRCLELVMLVIGATALDPLRLRSCANPGCVLLFYDTSKGGRRRWHDMATCGNQAKAASHYARTHHRLRTD